MLLTLNLNDRSVWPLVTAGYRHYVYVKGRWADPWIRRDDLHCEQAVWSTAPELPTATLVYRYGRVKVPGKNTNQLLTPISIRGWWVCVRYPCDDGCLDWYGFAESPITQEHQGATSLEPATGIQIIPCYGLDRALQITHVHDSMWIRKGETDSVRGGSPLVFGAHRRGPDRVNDLANGGTAYPFTDDPDGAKWTQRDVLEHLVEFHTPRSLGGIDWEVGDLTSVPQLDVDLLDTDGMTLYDSITQLCTRENLLTWSVAPPLYSAPAAAAALPPPPVPIQVVPHSLSLDPITVKTKTVAMPALRKWDIVCDRDPFTQATPSESSIDVVDQVLIVGAKRVSVCTLDRGKVPDGWELENDWSDDDLSDYNIGGSALAAYATANPLDKERIDEEQRRTGHMAKVFSYFRLPKEWTYQASLEAVFPADFRTPDGDSHKPFPGALRLLSSLPLGTTTDYSRPIEEWENKSRAGDEKPMIVSLQLPRFPGDPVPTEPEKRFVPVHRVGGADQLPSRKRNLKIRVRAYTLPPTRSEPTKLVIAVEGLPQHIIGGQDFDGNDVDKDKATPNNEWDYKTMRATVAIEEDRRVMAAWPTTLPSLDVVRRRVFQMPQYGSVYIVPQTTVAYDPEGKPIKSPGGFARDDSEQMTLLARRLAAYYTQPRRSVTIQTRRLISQLRVGDLVRTCTAASGPVNAPISRIEINSPLGRNGQPAPAPTQSIAVTAVPLDIERLLGIR